MKLLVLFACVALCLADISHDDATAWNKFKKKFGKHYDSEIEDMRRFEIFRANKESIEKHNEGFRKGEFTYWQGINQFSDMTDKEFAETMLTYRSVKPENTTQPDPIPIGEAPEEKDWREEGAVSHVKDQKNCGSCWAFATTASLEGIHQIKFGEMVTLSEQQLVDCSKQNNGCSGGMMDRAYKYIKKNGGINGDSTYPYEARRRKCRAKPEDNVASITDYNHHYHENKEDILKEAVGTIGPIAVAIRSTKNFRNYMGGILIDNKCKRKAINHGVTVVGYGRENGIDFWIIKNSWGTDWGAQGYIKMARNQNNMCKIASDWSYPII